MTTDTIFVTLSTFAEHDATPLEMLKRSGFPLLINTSSKRITSQQLLSMGRDATVVIAGVEPYDAATIDHLPALKCISRCGAGTDSVDLEAAKKRGIAVLNTPEVPVQAVAELAVTMMLALSRNLRKQTELMHRHEWIRIEAHLLAGKSVGLVGLGHIGRRVAELLAPFGTQLCASDPCANSTWAEAHAVTLMPLEQILTSCDIVSLHAKSSADHPLHIGKAEIAAMKRGAMLINLARGNMVDEAALYDALTSGQLSGAGLDVYPEEPYQGRLCDLDNVLLTPHAATLTVETRVSMELECVEKALRFLRGTIRLEERVV
jgi:D-3-phosphoglycerate dehydrogenase